MGTAQNREELVRGFVNAAVALLEHTCRTENERLNQQVKEMLATQGATNARSKAVDEPRLLLGPREAAKLLSISTGTLYNLSSPRGPIPYIKLGARTCYAVKDLEALIEKLKITR